MYPEKADQSLMKDSSITRRILDTIMPINPLFDTSSESSAGFNHGQPFYIPEPFPMNVSLRHPFVRQPETIRLILIKPTLSSTMMPKKSSKTSNDLSNG